MRVLPGAVEKTLPTPPKARTFALESEAERLAERWGPTARANQPGLVDTLNGFLSFTGAEAPLGVHTASLHIGTEEGRPTYRFTLNRRAATAGEIRAAVDDPETLTTWAREVIARTHERARARYRSLLAEGRVARLPEAHSRKPDAEPSSSIWANLREIGKVFGGEIAGWLRRAG